MLTIRNDFPILLNKPNWVYLDTAATALKPCVLSDRLKKFYDEEYATVNRAVYKESLIATTFFHETKALLAKFFHVQEEEIIFTKSTTESINLLAHTLGETLKEGDAILLSEAEHHSNIVPWQLLAQRKNLKIKVFSVTGDGDIDFDSFNQQLTPDVKIVSVCHVSNVLGTIFPIKKIAQLAKKNQSIIIVDGAQAPFHLDVNLKDLDIDFYACSMHKLYGPTGVGLLYGRKSLLEKLPPFLGGGDMIQLVSFEKTTFQTPPLRFEAGTPNIADVIAFGSVMHYLNQFPLKSIFEHERKLTEYLRESLNSIEGLEFIGNSTNKIGIFSFVIEGIHPLDLALYLDSKEIAVRSGHLCAQPLMKKFQKEQVVRASIGIYTTVNDIDRLTLALKKAIEIFKN